MSLNSLLPDDSIPTPPHQCLYCQSTNISFDEEFGCYRCLNPYCNEQWHYSSDTPFSELIADDDLDEKFDWLEKIELLPGYDRDFDEPLYIDSRLYKGAVVLEDDLD